MIWEGEVLVSEPDTLYGVRYFGGSIARFELVSDGKGGTDLMLTDSGVRKADWSETQTGWVSVLMGLKAAADSGIDLRNHDPEGTWDQGFVDN